LKLNHGGKAVFFIPYALGYGDQGTPDGGIPAKSNLVFYVEVE
jgi:FKBP-type peptidyl-prolyl cis-trans isomerase